MMSYTTMSIPRCVTFKTIIANSIVPKKTFQKEVDNIFGHFIFFQN